MDSTFINAYIRFLTVLVSGVPRWWFDITQKMIRSFLTEENTSPQHIVIRHILKLMPTAVSSLQSIITNNFPHKNETKEITVNYVENLLKIIDYSPESRSSIWSLIFERILQQDVELQDMIDSDDEEEEEDDEDQDDDEDDSSDDDSDEDSDDGSLTPTHAENSNNLTGRIKIESEGVADVANMIQSNVDSKEVETVNGQQQQQQHHHQSDPEDEDEEEDGLHGMETLFDNDEFNYDVDGGINYFRLRNTLDSLITLLFEYIEKRLTSETILEENGPAQVLFTILLSNFQNYILPTHRTRCVQFIIFRAAHAHPALLDAFLVSLIDIALSPIENMDRRLKAVEYISSFIARARGLSRTKVLFVVSIFADWLKRYVEEREHEVDEDNGALGMGRFKIFYAVTQALMYMFCFHHEIMRANYNPSLKASSKRAADNTQRRNDLINGSLHADHEQEEILSLKTSADSEWECNLDRLFQRLIVSKFNPLKYCSDSVVSKFAQIALHENLAYCFTIMEQNRLGRHRTASASISSSRSASGQGTTSQSSSMFKLNLNKQFVMLDAVFPFDPLHLPVAKKMVDDIYNEWVSTEDSDSDDEEEEEEEEIDDDDDDMSE